MLRIIPTSKNEKIKTNIRVASQSMAPIWCVYESSFEYFLSVNIEHLLDDIAIHRVLKYEKKCNLGKSKINVFLKKNSNSAALKGR